MENIAFMYKKRYLWVKRSARYLWVKHDDHDDHDDYDDHDDDDHDDDDHDDNDGRDSAPKSQIHSRRVTKNTESSVKVSPAQRNYTPTCNQYDKEL